MNTYTHESFILGNTYSFRTLNNFHNVVIEGVLEGTCSFKIAKSVSDVVAYNENVIRSVDEEDRDEFEYPEVLNYLIFRVKKTDNENVTTEEVKAYAIEWLLDGSLVNLTDVGNVEIVVYSVTQSDVSNIALLLTQNGYRHRVKV